MNAKPDAAARAAIPEEATGLAPSVIQGMELSRQWDALRHISD